MPRSMTMAASLSDARAREMEGEVEAVFASEIEVNERRRKIQEPIVAELFDSIEEFGLAQPIGVKRRGAGNGKTYTLVFGAHRLEAWRRKLGEAEASGDRERIGRWTLIPAVVYPVGMPDRLAGILEITENLKRADLSREERKRHETEYGEKMIEERNEEGDSVAMQPKTGSVASQPKRGGAAQLTEGGQLFVDWRKGAKVEKSTASREWKAFKEACDVKSSSDKCSPDEFERFITWRGKKGEEAKAAADAKAAEQATLAANKARTTRLARFKEAGQEMLDSGDGEAAILDAVRELLPDLKITAMKS